MPRPLSGSRLIVWLALFWLLGAVPLAAQAPERSLTLAEYRAELAAAIAELEAVATADAAEVLEQLQERFATITQVVLPSGEQVVVQSLLEDLSPPNDQSLAGGAAEMHTPQELALLRMRGALGQIDASANDDTAARLAILAEILARPEFNTPLSLWDRFWQWLRRLLSELLPDSQPSGESGWLAFLIRLIPWFFTILIVAAVIWLLSYWLQRFLRSLVADARIAALAGDADLPRSAAEARQQARIAAQSGFYRDAVRSLYLAALLQLSEHQLIDFERSFTNREVLNRVAGDSPIRPHLASVIATFDQVWYGVREPDRATFVAYEQEIDKLAAVAEHTTAAPAQQGDA
jgi:hypothetical protein